ncbi:MAG: lipopolysaccharide biosynthesis protein RfbH, partial [Clostridia bacterium]|nr:lipopolysaccharide biosynthesis protein RfbH [Clostridia bacterium]
MFELGSIISVSGQNFVVVEVQQKSIVAYMCSLSDGRYVIDTTSKAELTYDELNQKDIQQLGQIDNRQLEKAKRKLIFEKVEEFHDLFHQRKPFVAGTTPLS